MEVHRDVEYLNIPKATLPLIVVIVILSPAALWPCSPRIFLRHQIEQTEVGVDLKPPTVPEVGTVSVTRGHASIVKGDYIIVNTCAEIGSALLTWKVTPSDDRTPLGKLGVTWRLAKGKLPAGLREPDQVEFLPNPEHGYMIDWNDGDTNGENPVDFEVTMVLVDLAGNRTVAQTPLRIQHGGNKK